MITILGHFGLFFFVAFSTYVLCMTRGKGPLAAAAFFALLASPFVAVHVLGWYALITVFAGWVSGAKTAAYGKQHPIK